jgi:hypothetical protein
VDRGIFKCERLERWSFELSLPFSILPSSRTAKVVLAGKSRSLIEMETEVERRIQ